MNAQQNAYRAEIDGLRAIAVLLVVAHHAFPRKLPGGYIGVDVFFVISGYLIGLLVLQQMAEGKFSFAEFYARRIKRILPALILVFIACLTAGWWILLPDEYKKLGRHVAYGTVFWLNFIFKGEIGYFDSAANLKPLLHLWSLGIEEQFYLVWPVAALAIHRAGINMLTMLIVAAAVSLSACIHFNNSGPVAFYHPATRAWELLLGTLAAHLQLHHRAQFLNYRQIIFLSKGSPAATRGMLDDIQVIAGIALLIACSIFYSKTNPGIYSLPPIFGTLLIITATPTCRASKILLANKAMVLIGLISYPFYLWHWPLISFATMMETGFPSTGIRIFIVLLSGLLAYLTWVLLEKRTRHHPSPSMPAILVAALLTVGLAGFFVHKANGFRDRTADANKYADQLDQSWFKMHKNCPKDFNPLPDAYCFQNNPGAPDIALIGDSHALHSYLGMSEFYKKHNKNVALLGGSGCPPFYGLERPSVKCQPIIKYALDYSISSNKITTIILANRGPRYIEGVGTPHETKGNGTKELITFEPNLTARTNEDVYEESLKMTLGALTRAGKQVILVIDVPEVDLDPRSCVKIRPVTLTEREIRQPCAISKAEYIERSKNYIRVTRKALENFPQLLVWDTPKNFCDDAYCKAMIGEKLLYRDDDHLSVNGSHWLAERFDPEPSQQWIARQDRSLIHGHPTP